MPVVPRFKSPLSIEELREIQARRHDDKDVMRLLWEIRRLHSIVLRADQLMRTIDESGGIAHRLVVEAMRNDLKGEPSLADIRSIREDMASEKSEKKPYRHPTDR